jgi:hypothetical protein
MPHMAAACRPRNTSDFAAPVLKEGILVCGRSRKNAGIVLVALLALLIFSSCGYAQQTTGQLLISSGFNPIAATTPKMLARLMSFPANQFVLRQKGNRSYYIYADPSGCTCAFVGGLTAMDKYRVTFGALPADTLSSGDFTSPEQNLIDSMADDAAGADVFAPDD